LTVRDGSGRRSRLVFRTATPNQFGHEHRADRAAEMVLAYDTFPLVPHQVRALDVGVIQSNHQLHSLASAGELYLLTEYIDGAIYADDLRRIATSGTLGP